MPGQSGFGRIPVGVLRRQTGVTAGLRQIEAESDANAVCGMCRAAVPAEIELRFPPSAMMKCVDMAGGRGLEAIRVEQL